MVTLKGTIQKIYEYQEGIEFILNTSNMDEVRVDNTEERKKLKVLKNCPLDGQPINYDEGSEDESYHSIFESFDHDAPSPCYSCMLLRLASDTDEAYGVSGICKRYSEFDPDKVTLFRWM